MKSDASPSDPGQVTPLPADKQPRRSLLGVIRARRGTLVWGAIISLMVLIMWPMLKGSYYRIMGTPAPPDGISWRTDYAAALAEAKESGKPVLLDFTASWCPPCQVMKHEVWPEAEVRSAVVKGYIPVMLDVDQPGSAAAAARYQVRTIPAVLVVNADGNILRAGSFMSKGQMLGFLWSGSD